MPSRPGQIPTSPVADIYSLGVLLMHLLPEHWALQVCGPALAADMPAQMILCGQVGRCQLAN